MCNGRSCQNLDVTYFGMQGMEANVRYPSTLHAGLVARASNPAQFIHPTCQTNKKIIIFEDKHTAYHVSRYIPAGQWWSRHSSTHTSVHPMLLSEAILSGTTKTIGTVLQVCFSTVHCNSSNSAYYL